MLRVVPSTSASSGITFHVFPAAICVTLTTPAENGLRLRATTVCTDWMNAAARTIGSTPDSGCAACVPVPWKRKTKRSTAAITAPSEMPTVPTSMSGEACRPKIAATSFNAPASMSTFAPPGASSAGWKKMRTRPVSSCSCCLSRSAAPSTDEIWKSCPQACIRPLCSERYGRSVCSSIGRASISVRSATSGSPCPTSATSPVLSGRSRMRIPARSKEARIRFVVSTSS